MGPRHHLQDDVVDLRISILQIARRSAPRIEAPEVVSRNIDVVLRQRLEEKDEYQRIKEEGDAPREALAGEPPDQQSSEVDERDVEKGELHRERYTRGEMKNEK
jgi:hypothetical protein